MRTLPALLCLLVGSCVVACGGPPAPLRPPSAGATSLPPSSWHRVLTFEVDLAGARAARRIADTQSDEEILGDTIAVVSERLIASGMGPFGLAVLPGARFEVGFGFLSEADEKLVQGLVARRGTLEFAIEVLPDSVYLAMQGPTEAPPVRLGLWSGTPEAFATFKAAEWDRWKKMQAEPGGYTPSRSDMRLVPMRDRDGTQIEHYRFIEHKPADERLTGRILKDAMQTIDQRGRPAVVFDIRRNYQGVLASFTQSNIGLPLAIMVDEALVSAPRIMDTLSTNVQISMGTKARAELLRDARDLATVLQSRSLPFTPQLVQAESR